ncbi:NnrS family protein [Falsiroseomonas sp. E2-1-a20]|uniref:NnrS family protein n=1 Tax=Falsiroseomonas sp. E2-1-a20 TaxID=3239300 RepID=UPI003F3BE111
MKYVSLSTHRVLFGLALIQGAGAILAWTFAALPAAGGPAWHAHEMVFGQALAVVGGYLLSRLKALALVSIAAVWIAARTAALVPATPEEVRAALSIAATTAIVLPAALAFLRGAKRSGNFVFPGVLGGFVVADILFQLGETGVITSTREAGLMLGMGLVVLLITAMGGRLLSAAASGASQRTGGARLPPRHGLERALMALLASAFLAEAFAAVSPAGPVLLAIGGVLLGVRVVLWVPGLRRSGGDILALAAGQVWLGLGLVAWAWAAAGLPTPLPGLAALHLATVGGIGGTLLVMMIRATAQREGRPMPGRAAGLVASLMAVAALSRAAGTPDFGWALAALFWLAATLVAAANVFRRGPR